MHLEGTGGGYRFTDDYTEDVSSGEMMTQKHGFSDKDTWSSIIKQTPGKFYVNNIGQDTNSSWEETWNEEPALKWAKKRGSSHIWGEWEEYWKDTPQLKECKKWGKKEDEWFEEWKEELNKKYCRKEQRKEGKVFIQEWNEFYEDGKMLTKGKFTEDGVLVKEWDDVVFFNI